MKNVIATVALKLCQVKVAHAVEVVVIRHAGGTIAEAELGAEIDMDFATAIRGRARTCSTPGSWPTTDGQACLPPGLSPRRRTTDVW